MAQRRPDQGSGSAAVNGGLRRAAARAAVALATRQVVTFTASLLTGILLARTLAPDQFGALALIVFVVNMGKVLVDLGLSASLIRLPDEPTAADREAIFTLEWLIAILITAGVLIAAPTLSQAVNASPGTALAMQVGVLSLLTVPVTSLIGADLERRIDFQRQGLLLALPPVLFGAIAVPLAISGAGVLALGIGQLTSNVGTMIVALLLRRPLPRLTARLRPARPHVRFGVPYMSVSVVSAVKDSVVPLLLGVLAGAAAVGYVSWAQQVATLGTYALSILSRLLFPLFARLQTDPERLSAVVTRTLFAANLLVAPISAALAVFAPSITAIFYGPQWAVAVPLVYLLMVANLVAPMSTVLLTLMGALGMPRVSLLFAIFWFAGTWTLVALLTPSLGWAAYGWANLGVQAFSLGLLAVARRRLRFSWLRPIGLPWLLAVAAFILAGLVEQTAHINVSFLPLVALGLLGVALYFGGLLVLARDDLLEIIRVFRRS